MRQTADEAMDLSVGPKVVDNRIESALQNPVKSDDRGGKDRQCDRVGPNRLTSIDVPEDAGQTRRFPAELSRGRWIFLA